MPPLNASPDARSDCGRLCPQAARGRVTVKKHAVKFLKQGKSQRTVAQLTGLLKGSVFSLKNVTEEERWDELAQHCHDEKSRKVGAPTVLTTNEERMIVERLQ